VGWTCCAPCPTARWISRTTCGTLHYTTLHCTTLHCTTLHYTTLYYTTLHYTIPYDIWISIPLHFLSSVQLHYTTLHCTTLHCTALGSYMGLCTMLSKPMPMTTGILHYTTLHYTTLHYTTQLPDDRHHRQLCFKGCRPISDRYHHHCYYYYYH